MSRRLAALALDAGGEPLSRTAFRLLMSALIPNPRDRARVLRQELEELGLRERDAA